jgi:uncharacterized protein (DUF2235 family)
VPKRIFLLSDGTGNSSGKLFRTNVWKFYQALDLTKSDQVAYYDDGVGTSSFRPLAIIGGMFGWGLKRNVFGPLLLPLPNIRRRESDCWDRI